MKKFFSRGKKSLCKRTVRKAACPQVAGMHGGYTAPAPGARSYCLLAPDGGCRASNTPARCFDENHHAGGMAVHVDAVCLNSRYGFEEFGGGVGIGRADNVFQTALAVVDGLNGNVEQYTHGSGRQADCSVEKQLIIIWIEIGE